jgi:hypothetical protein
MFWVCVEGVTHRLSFTDQNLRNRVENFRHLSEPILNEAEVREVSGAEPQQLRKEAAEVVLVLLRRLQQELDRQRRKKFLKISFFGNLNAEVPENIVFWVTSMPKVLNLKSYYLLSDFKKQAKYPFSSFSFFNVNKILK